jgi:hypothetical protein
MIAPNGDHPTSARVIHHARAISIAQSLPSHPRPFTHELFPKMNLDMDPTLMYGVLGGLVLLLFALLWSLLP